MIFYERVNMNSGQESAIIFFATDAQIGTDKFEENLCICGKKENTIIYSNDSSQSPPSLYPEQGIGSFFRF